MDLVIDASAVIAVVANEPEKAALIEQTHGAILHAPASLAWEIGNALSAMLKRQRITIDQATAVFRSYSQIPIRLLDVDVFRALAHAAQLGIYAYDAYMIQAAEDQDCPLLTLDGGLIQAAKAVGVRVMGVAT